MSKGSEHIDRIFQERLTQYESPVPSHIWANIESARKQKRDRGFLPFRWLGLGVVVLLVGATALWIGLDRSTSGTPAAASSSDHTSLSALPSTDGKAAESVVRSETGAASVPAPVTAPGNSEVNDRRAASATEKASGLSSSSGPDLEGGQGLPPEQTPDSDMDKEAPMPSALAPNLSSGQEEEFMEKGIELEKSAFTGVVAPLAAGIAEVPALSSQADLPGPSSCASFKQRLDWSWHWYLEALGGPEFAVRTLTARQPESVEYAQQRKATEELRTSFSTGIRLGAVTPFGLSIRTGVQYTQINERFNYTNESEVREVITNIYDGAGNIVGTDTAYQSGTRIKVTHNRYRLIDLPLLVGYEINYPKFSLTLHGGPIINLAFSQKGDFLSEGGIPVSFTSGDPNAVTAFQDQIGLSFGGGVGMHYRLNSDVLFILEPHFRYFPQSFTQASYPLDQSYFTTGISTGVRLRLY